MKELKPRIHENGIDYILVGDYYVPDRKLPEEHRPIGRWGNLHRAYLRQFCPALYSTLVLSGELHTYLADLNEQATERCSLMGDQSRNSKLHFGMGLYITNSIMEQHNGQLILENSKETGGAKVTMKLPC